MLHPVPPPEERTCIAAERRAKKRANDNSLRVDALDHQDHQDQPAEGSPVQSVPDSAPDLNRPLHPFEKPDESPIHNLLDLVWAALPPVPDIYDQSKLSGTRKPTKSFDLALPGDKQLKYIVFCKDMLSPVEGDVAALLKDIAIDWDNDAHRTFVARVFPWMRAMDNAKQINSEVDTEDWINSVLVRPAIAVLHAIILGHIPEDVDPRYPFSCSSHNKRSTRPDFLIILRGRHPRESIAGCGEYKTHKIIAEGDNPLWLVQRPIPNHPHWGLQIQLAILVVGS
ncbi:hypothetical protein EWM64_g4099 [Hericium alpestre]|uniref:Uncharacterized protein n=1 Tax=Hericium alpestre TaxID=135208 RepID=A0A4Y9ZZJ4_9AGAM|nr:hypothetical protein EWM64_g4099 [Hericium alpestre]